MHQEKVVTAVLCHVNALFKRAISACHGTSCGHKYILTLRQVAGAPAATPRRHGYAQFVNTRQNAAPASKKQTVFAQLEPFSEAFLRNVTIFLSPLSKQITICFLISS